MPPPQTPLENSQRSAPHTSYIAVFRPRPLLLRGGEVRQKRGRDRKEEGGKGRGWERRGGKDQ